MKRLGILSLLLLFAFTCLLPVPARSEESDKPTGKQLTVVVKKDSSEAAPEPTRRVVELASGVADRSYDWNERYVENPTGELSEAARTTLKVATAEGYDRKQCVKDIKEGGEKTKTLFRNLDVGRHEVMKQIYRKALVLANERLKKKGASPLRKVLPVNCGGTGDYTRDQDITVFAGDPEVEKVFFESVAEVAAGPPFHLEVAHDKSTGGIDFPQIEVTLFPGGNDLPDSRFATDVEDFKLTYSELLARQKANVEAYLGGGADIEVKGRRRPGQLYVQELTYDDDGNVGYRAEVPGNEREAGALFRDYGPERFNRWQHASHVFSDMLQGWRHNRGEDHDPTKGPLKYLGRALEQMCRLSGKEPWNDKTPMDEKVAVIARLWPQLDPKNPEHRRILEKRVTVFEIAHFVKVNKKLPDGVNGKLGTRMALLLLRKSVAATAGEMAKEMLCPPRFDLEKLHPDERERFRRMTPEQRDIELRKRDSIYRQCVSHEAMENLLLTMEMLRTIDVEEGRIRGTEHGEAAIRQMIDTAPPELERVLTIAAEYSSLAAELKGSVHPMERSALRGRMNELRQRLSSEVPGGMPGERVIKDMERMGPERYMGEVLAGKPPPMGSAMEEIRKRFDEHLRQAFPSAKEEYQAFRMDLARRGAKGYVVKRLADEAFQLDTISDGLTLIEMYQGGATAYQYAEFLTINILSRAHWSIGQLIAAARVGSVDQAKELAKNLVFMTLARLVPGAGQAKVVFDIMRGIVTVTVGWSVNVANADLVDALYTGEAGRKDESAAGTARGALRDSGFCVLPASCVIRTTDEKTKELRIFVNRAAVYEQAFAKWTGGLDPYAVSSRGTVDPKLSILVHAHDRLAKLLVRQAEQEEPTWVYSTKTPRITMPLDADDVESAVSSLLTSLKNWCGREAERVHSESGARSYKSFFDSEDAIVKGLRDRYVNDVLGGMIDAWQTRITARVLAMRQIERTAISADYATLARETTKGLEKWLRRGPATGDAAPVYELETRVDGAPLPDEDAFDGGQPIRVSGYLHGSGDVGESPPEVRIQVLPGTPKIIAKGVRPGQDPEKADLTKIEPGDLIEDHVTVRAVPIAGGPPLAEEEETIRVRLPAPKGTITVPILRHEERRSDGSLKEAFEYIKSFFEMPREWVEEYGYVYHGHYESFSPEEKKTEERNYEFGVLDGPVRFFDREGRLVHEIPYVNGEIHGLERKLDPESDARLELQYVHGWLAEQRSYSETGQILRKITYRQVDDPEDPRGSMSGTAEAWWTNGARRWRGAYENYTQDLNERGGYDGETIGGKSGTWEWFFEDGSPNRRCDFQDGRMHGSYELRREDGTIAERGSFENGRASGVWERTHENGKLSEKGPMRDDVKDGVWQTWYEDGTLESTGGWAAGRRHGEWVTYDGEGRIYEKGVYADDEKTGEWFETRNGGSEEWRGSYAHGKRTGPFTYHRVEDGKRWLAAEENYVEGELDGPYVSYFPDGSIGSKGKYEAGKRTGPWEHHDESGGREVGEYADDMRTGTWSIYSKGEDGEHLVARGDYEEDYREGEWSFYDEDGKLTGIAIYRDGEVIERRE